MNNGETNIWGIHAGRLGEADNLFLKENVVGLGDPDLVLCPVNILNK